MLMSNVYFFCILIIVSLLPACQVQPVQKPPSSKVSPNPLSEINLFEQPYIDPLTDYLKKNQNKAELRDTLARIKAEKEKRCADIAVRYQQRDKTQTNLDKLRSAYQYSCPHVVEAFAQLLNTSPQSVLKSDKINEKTFVHSNQVPQIVNSGAMQDSQTYATYRQQVLSSCRLKLAEKAMQAVIDTCQHLAQQGEALAQSYLGTAYLQLQQAPQAEFWWREAAKQGLAHAQYRLGVLYAEGKLVKQDWTQAFKWLQRAAQQGLSAAQYSLGQLYAMGQSVKQDTIEALAWWSLASQQGHTNAKIQQARLREQLTPLQWQQVQRRTQQLKQRYMGQP